jgi:hypothetical protein
VLKLGLQNHTHAMIINELKIIEIFCQLDDFVKSCETFSSYKLLGKDSPQSINRPSISLSEMMCIEILYHHSGHKCFEYYYQFSILKGSLGKLFPNAPSYSRYIQLKPRVFTCMVLFLHACRLGRFCGLYYADSTSLSVCNNRRINSHKVFKKQAARGKSSMGWFYGFKLFLVVNAFGELVKVAFGQANVADNNTDMMLKLFSKLSGWAFADKGFINGKATEELFLKGLHIVTGIRSNMKNKLVNFQQKLLLKKRGMIESINDILKTVCDIEHTRHRSPINALVNLYAGLVAYTFLDRLPNIFSR